MGLLGFKNMGPEVAARFKSIGWKAASADGCVGCGVCATTCPMEAITVSADSITVSGDCIGCGVCALKCPKDAIKMKQTGPIKKNIIDYFWGFTPQI